MIRPSFDPRRPALGAARPRARPTFTPLAPLAIAAAALCVHCSGDEGWDAEGRVYATVEAAVARTQVSLIERPVDEGDAVYVAAFEIPGGFVRQPWSDARAFVEFPPGVTLGDGDEPVFCAEYAVSDEATLRACSSLVDGAAAAEADLSGGAVWRYWLADLPRSVGTIAIRRASLEVRRLATGPSLEASAWRLHIVDGSCDQVLASRSDAAACDPARAGADCSWVGETTFEVDAGVCRMRRTPG